MPSRGGLARDANDGGEDPDAESSEEKGEANAEQDGTQSERWRWRRNSHTWLFSSMMAERDMILIERERETKTVSC